MSGGFSGHRLVQVGSSTSATTAPVAYVFTDPQGDVTPVTEQTKLDVDLQRDDGEITAGILGPKAGNLPLTLLLRGKGGDQADGEASDPPEDLESILDVVMGVDADKGSSDTTGAGNTVTLLKFAATANWAVGDGIMVDSDATAGTRYECRPITSLDTDTSITVGTDLTGAPADSALVHSSAAWHLDADATELNYLWTKTEGENWMREHKGCGVTASLSAPPGGIATLSLDCIANDWTDTAEENPSYSAVTAEPALTVMGAPFYWNDALTELISFELDFGVGWSPRTATSGENGQNGWVRAYSGGSLSATIYHTEAIENAMQLAATYECMFQLGPVDSAATPGSAAMIYMPAMDVKSVNRVIHNGVDAIQFTALATRPAVGSSLSVHVYGKA